MALHHEQIPATLHYENPNPQIDFENSPFYVCNELTEWTRTLEPRRAGVSAFGVGGTNAHILLEESPEIASDGEANESNELPVSILPVSGKTEDALCENVTNLAQTLSGSEGELVEIAQTLQQGRDEFIYRAAIVSDDLQDAQQHLLRKSRHGL